MDYNDISTRQLIIDAGKKEFLEKGLQGASLRNIAKLAHVTTGAMYGYFKSKEDLFATIVGPCCAAVKCRFRHDRNTFFELPDKNEFDTINWMIDYIYNHFEVFKILICCSDGTSFESFVHEMVEIEVKATFAYLEAHTGKKPDLDVSLCHMIASGMFGGIFELIEHDIPKEKAKPFVEKLREFNHAGWIQILK